MSWCDCGHVSWNEPSIISSSSSSLFLLLCSFLTLIVCFLHENWLICVTSHLHVFQEICPLLVSKVSSFPSPCFIWNLCCHLCFLLTCEGSLSPIISTVTVHVQVTYSVPPLHVQTYSTGQRNVCLNGNIHFTLIWLMRRREPQINLNPRLK